MATTASPIPIQLMVRSFSLKAIKPTNAAIVTNAALNTGIKKTNVHMTECIDEKKW